MTGHLEQLDSWHLELAIMADAVYEVLTGIEGRELSATAHVLKTALVDWVEQCPFPASPGLPAQGSAEGPACENQLGKGGEDA